MARLSRSRRGTTRRSEVRRIRNAFSLLMVFSVVTLTVFSLLAGSTTFASLGSWKPSVFFCFALVFAVLSYKGADVAMFGAYVTAYFVSSASRGRETQQGTSRDEVWGLQRYLHRPRARALATSAVAMFYGVAALLAYVAFVVLGSHELAYVFDRPRTPTVVGLLIATLTLVVTVPAALGSVTALKTYFAAVSSRRQSETVEGGTFPPDK